jgi:hypothetical protein
MRVLLRVFVGLIAIYLLMAGALFAIMWLPPGQFAAVAAHIPGPVMMMGFPFRAAWSVARGGSLSPGDPAPNFDLARHDKSGRVSLQQHAGRPVVLIFGSYT